MSHVADGEDRFSTLEDFPRGFHGMCWFAFRCSFSACSRGPAGGQGHWRLQLRRLFATLPGSACDWIPRKLEHLLRREFSGSVLGAHCSPLQTPSRVGLRARKGHVQGGLSRPDPEGGWQEEPNSFHPFVPHSSVDWKKKREIGADLEMWRRGGGWSEHLPGMLWQLPSGGLD